MGGFWRLSRLAGLEIGSSAIQDTALLDAVVRFKSVFFASNRARYDLAKAGSLRLIPPAIRRDSLVRDYEQMAPMLFGDVPTLDDILAQLADLERRING